MESLQENQVVEEHVEEGLVEETTAIEEENATQENEKKDILNGNGKLIAMAAAALAVVLCLIVAMVASPGGAENVDDVQDTTPIEDIVQTEPIVETEPVVLEPTNALPKLIIGGNEYYLGHVTLGDLLENFNIMNSEAFEDRPEYKQVKPGATLEVCLFDMSGNKFTVNLYNHTNEVLSFEDCKAQTVTFDRELLEDLYFVKLGESVGFTSNARAFVQLLGEWSEKNEEKGYNIYSWNVDGGLVEFKAHASKNEITTIKLYAKASSLKN